MSTYNPIEDLHATAAALQYPISRLAVDTKPPLTVDDEPVWTNQAQSYNDATDALLKVTPNLLNATATAIAKTSVQQLGVIIDAIYHNPYHTFTHDETLTALGQAIADLQRVT